MFKTNGICPGVTHITDAMGVSFTLIEGEKSAVLFDTGYGMDDVGAFIRTLTDKPVKVLLSHGHHDHMLGARWFGKTYLCKEDMDEFAERTGNLQRTKVMRQAAERGVPVPPDFLTVPVALPEAIRFSGKTGPFENKTEDLGGLEIRVIRVPGHTPGSIVLHVPDRGLLLTGDNWNPCTWMWFPSSINAREWRDNMFSLITALEEENGTEINRVICSHQPAVREGSELKGFLAYMTDGRLDSAPAVDMGAPINTHQVTEGEKGWMLVFDRDKIK